MDEHTELRIRPLGMPGDLGWVVMAHGEVYAEQFGWDAEMEALVARIVADYATEAGYEEITLWTNDVLESARRIYEAEGFTLVDEDQHHSFGQDLTSQNWSLRLVSERDARRPSLPSWSLSSCSQASCSLTSWPQSSCRRLLDR